MHLIVKCNWKGIQSRLAVKNSDRKNQSLSSQAPPLIRQYKDDRKEIDNRASSLEAALQYHYLFGHSPKSGNAAA
jgi:hypothetical protein